MHAGTQNRDGRTTGQHLRIADSGVRPTTARVLVVDDDRDIGGTLVLILSTLGFRGTAVTSGEAAVPLVMSEHPAVVLIDLCLPGLNGWDLARRVRAFHLPHQPCLVAITGLTDSVFRLRSMAAGFDDHLVKPIDIAELKRVLAVLT